MLLCDSAQGVGGKLYILGGGWTQVAEPPQGGLVMGLAVKLAIPWDRGNEKIPILIRLQNDQGESVLDPGGNAIEAQTELELGRPPGLKRGTPLDACLALNFMGLPLREGNYVWTLETDGSVKCRAPFRVVSQG
jgi:hypothetical protein